MTNSLRPGLDDTGYCAIPGVGVFSQWVVKFIFEGLVEELTVNSVPEMANQIATIVLGRVVLSGALAIDIAERLPKAWDHFSTFVDRGLVMVWTVMLTGILIESAGSVGASYLWD